MAFVVIGALITAWFAVDLVLAAKIRHGKSDGDYVLFGLKWFAVQLVITALLGAVLYVELVL